MSFIGNLGMNAATQVIGQGLGLVAGGIQDKRQRKQQQALTDIQSEANKRQAEHSSKLAMDMWNNTSYGAQADKMREAGLNVGLMYGGSGGGGGTTAGAGQAGAVSGGSAGDPNAGVGMGMQMASQLALMKAQKENIEADTANKRAGEGAQTAGAEKTQAETKGIKVESEAKEKIGSDAIAERYQWAKDREGIATEKENADWENFKQVGYSGDGKGGASFIDENSMVSKARKAGWNEAIAKAEQARIENNIGRAEQAVKEFEAGLAKQGISPNSPWWAKIVGDLLEKIGLSPLTGIKGALK